VVELANVTKGYDGRTLIKDFTYDFTPEDRIGIIGGNGAGKSTLMDIITGRVQPDSGKVEIGSTIHIGYFDQHSDDLAINPEQRVIEYLKEVAELVKTSDGSIITASQMLERFLFPGNQQYAPINKLSGGERRRLFLLRVLMSAPNLLILDEPTNDLDVQTLAVLEEYLEEFNGCVIVVSHDRYFLDRTVETIFALQPGGELRQYPGNYSVYLDYRKADEEAELPSKGDGQKKSEKSETPPVSVAAQSITESPVVSSAVAVKTRKLSYKEKHELETLGTKIPQMEAEKTELATLLYKKPPSGFSEVKQLSERLSELEKSIDKATERWLVLSELES